MRRSHYLIVFAIFMGLSCPAFSEEPDNSRIVFAGVGAIQCAELARTAKTDPTGTKNLTDAWFQGFFTSLNLIFFTKGQPTYDLAPLAPARSTDRIWEEVSSYCDQHPLGYVYQASEVLGKSLTFIKPHP